MTRVACPDAGLSADAAYLGINRWNGWEVPYFTREEGMKLIPQTEKLRADHGPEVAVLSWDDDRSAFVLTVDAATYPDEGFEFVEPVEFEGLTLYGIGAFSWTWELAE